MCALIVEWQQVAVERLLWWAEFTKHVDVPDSFREPKLAGTSETDHYLPVFRGQVAKVALAEGGEVADSDGPVIAAFRTRSRVVDTHENHYLGGTLAPDLSVVRGSALAAATSVAATAELQVTTAVKILAL